jgi:hypothetical protein
VAIDGLLVAVLDGKRMMNRLLVVCWFAVPAVAMCGCSRTEYSGEQRFPLSGRVSVDGQPMEFGVISFLPQEKGRVSGGPITGGSYSVPEAMGANAGPYRVEIHWNKPTGKRVRDPYGEEIMDEYKEGLPERYHKNSELTAEVSPGQTTLTSI